jgi:ATP-dependent Lhr-like helicase
LTDDLSAPAREVLGALSQHEAMFPQALQKVANLLPDYLEMGLAELLAHGLITCDSFSGLRQMITPPSRRRTSVRAMGRWTLFRGASCSSPSGRGWPVTRPGEGVANQRLGEGVANQGLSDGVKNQQSPNSMRTASSQDQSTPILRALTRPEYRPPSPALGGGRGANTHSPQHEAANEMAARQLLQRTGVVFRRTLLREKLPVSWTTLIRIYRRMELRGEIRGGRFVAGYAGEQFALPNAVELLRSSRRQGPHEPVSVASADPLNFQGILTPDKRIAPSVNQQVLVG